jgi:hypothetical protein
MLRLLLGLVVAIGILYGGLHLMGRRAQLAGATPGPGGPPQARPIVRDVTRIQTDNRAALDHTVQASEGR